MSAVNVLGDILLSIRNGKLSEDELQLVVEAVRVARQRNAATVVRTLRVGDSVKFSSQKRGEFVGTLMKVNIKKAIVKTSAGQWNVPLSMLSPA